MPCSLLLCTACLEPPAGATYPIRTCPEQRAPSDAAIEWQPSYEEPIPDVIPALAPDAEPKTLPAGSDGDDYPPPDLAAEAPPPTLVSVPDAAQEVIPALPVVPLSAGKARSLLAIDPQSARYKVNVPREYVACGEQYTSLVLICVSEAGNVSSVRTLQRSIPIIDLQLEPVISRWRYHPYLVDGRSTAFCYAMKYHVC